MNYTVGHVSGQTEIMLNWKTEQSIQETNKWSRILVVAHQHPESHTDIFLTYISWNTRMVCKKYSAVHSATLYITKSWTSAKYFTYYVDLILQCRVRRVAIQRHRYRFSWCLTIPEHSRAFQSEYTAHKHTNKSVFDFTLIPAWPDSKYMQNRHYKKLNNAQKNSELTILTHMQ